jgi:hypothetical protein
LSSFGFVSLNVLHSNLWMLSFGRRYLSRLTSRSLARAIRPMPTRVELMRRLAVRVIRPLPTAIGGGGTTLVGRGVATSSANLERAPDVEGATP